MLSYDLKFITTDETVHTKSNDLQTHKYETKKKQDESLYDLGKRSYIERRGEKWRAPRSGQIRELEILLRDRSVVFCEWTNDALITLVFSSGILAYLTVNPHNLVVNHILFDKYCVGKLTGQTVSSVVLSRSHMLFLHTERAATLVSFNVKKSPTDSSPTRIVDRAPRLQNIEVVGGVRRAERQVSWSEDDAGLRVLTWSTASSEPAPWSPISEDRANIHLYQIMGNQMTLIGYHQLDNETLSADLSKVQTNFVHIVEQITHQMNGICLEWVQYHIPTSDGTRSFATARESVTQVSLSAPARAVKRSPCDIRLLVSCIDGSLHIIHNEIGLTHTTRAGFIATEIQWAGDLVVAAEECGRLHCFDRALTVLQHTAKCIDLAQHIRDSRRLSLLAARRGRGGSAIVASFSGGPLALLRIMHPKLPSGWIRCGRLPRALSLVRALDWQVEGSECVSAVHAVLHASLRRGLLSGGEAAAQAALGTCMAERAVPAPPAVYDLARKFFHHLLRRGRIDKALSLGVDLSAWDLFADARWAALRAGLLDAAEEARVLTLDIASKDHHESSCSTSCSRCSSHTSSYTASEDETDDSHKTKAPPLPRIPAPPPQTTIMPVPLSNIEPMSTNSIRPNLHQYLERDLTIWKTEITEPSKFNNAYKKDSFSINANVKWPQSPKANGRNMLGINEAQTKRWHIPSHTVVDVIPRPQDERLGAAQYGEVFQTELTEEAPSIHSNMYRYHRNMNLMQDRNKLRNEKNYPDCHRLRQNGEKNKVKFSDKVTIAVVSDNSEMPHPSRELADSLPLSAPHAYLAAFTPARAATPPGTPTDYVEV